MSTDAFIEAYEKVKSAEAAAVEPEKVVEPATEEVSAEENKEQDVAAGSSEASGEVAAEDSGPDDLIEFQIGEETKQVPLSELVASYSEKQSAPKDVGLPQDILDMKQQLIEKLDVMEKILSDNSDGLQKVANFISKTYDVPNDIVASIKEALVFVMAKDAMLYHDMKMKSSEVLRPVKEAPKVIKRSVGKVTVTDSDIKQSNIRTLRANIRNSSSQAEKNNSLAGLWLEMKK